MSNQSVRELAFYGIYNSKIAYAQGDVCILDGKTCIFDGVGFQEIGETNTYCKEHESPKKIAYGTCKHCGAPLKEEVCEYCGVRNSK